MDWVLLLTIGASIATIIGLPIAVITFALQYKPKSFSYTIADTPIISIHQKIDGVVVTYKGKPVKNLRVVMVTVWNSGNVPIEETDFKVPITFCEEYTARGNSLVNVELVEAPKSSNAELFTYEAGHHSSMVALKNMLFNQGEYVTVKIIFADYGGENLDINVTGRIVGIKAFKREPYVNTLPPILRWFLVEKKHLSTTKI